MLQRRRKKKTPDLHYTTPIISHKELVHMIGASFLGGLVPRVRSVDSGYNIVLYGKTEYR